VFPLIKCLLLGLIAVFSVSVSAQTEFEKIDVGTVLTKEGIKLGIFVKPIPLPDGEWQVVNKRIEEIPLTRGGAATTPARDIWLTLKNNKASESPIFAIVMGFTPDAVPIRWNGNGNCENTNSKALVDDYGLTRDSLTYVCGKAWSLSNYKKRVSTTAESNSKWDKDNLTALSAFLEDIPDKVLQVGVSGNKDQGRKISLTFLLKREDDFLTNPDYAKYAKDWMHTAGISLKSILQNDAAIFALPSPFAAQTPQ